MPTEIKISELPAASSASGTMEFETNDSGTSKKVTGSQLKTYAQSDLGTAAFSATGDFAPSSKGVTNGDSHDHNGGDGAQIAYSSLSGLPTLGTIASQAANNVAITGGSISGITDLAIADGGTGASTAPAALANLGGVSTGKSIAMAIVFGS